jgi:hypothetical protein
MSIKGPLVDVELIRNMLYNDDAYVKEFAGASIQSFSEFKSSFRKHVLSRDLDELRRAGHKIKPAALMLNLNPVIDMYETSKEMLDNNAPESELESIANKMDAYCGQVLSEFEEISS